MKRRYKNKTKVVDEKKIGKMIEQELSAYVKQDDLREYLANIEKDKKKKELWDSMTTHKKIRVLRYVLAKKGVQHGKE